MRIELTEFLNDIWQDGGRVFLAWKQNPQSFDVPSPKHWPNDRDKVLDFILAVSAKAKDVYFAPPIYKPTAVNKESINVLHSWVLWAEFDGNAEEGLKLLASQGLPVPSYRLQSSLDGHEHWYWKLDKPAITEVFEPANKKLTYALHADKTGWDAATVLRPPFTSNQGFKKGVRVKPASPVDIVEKTGAVYSIEDFGELPSVNSSIRENTIELKGDLPTVGEVLATYTWDKQHLDIFNNPVDKDGTRDESLMRFSYFCAETGMTDEAMYVVLDDLTTRMGKFVGRADRERRLAELIAKARVKHPFSNVRITETHEDIQTVFFHNELLNAEFRLDWLVENMLPKGTINFLSAESGIGKSRLSMQLAECIASGKQFLDWPIQEKMKCMYLSLEMDRYMLKHFLESLSEGKEATEEISKNFMLVPVGNPISLMSEDGDRFIRHLLEEHKPDLLIIDALGSLTLGELTEVESKNIMARLKQLIADYGTTFYIIHHNRKPEKGNTKSAPTLSDVYGNQYLVTDAALILTMWAPDNQANVELITLKSRARKSDKNMVLDGTRGFRFILKDKTEDDGGIDEKPSL